MAGLHLLCTHGVKAEPTTRDRERPVHDGWLPAPQRLTGRLASHPYLAGLLLQKTGNEHPGQNRL